MAEKKEKKEKAIVDWGSKDLLRDYCQKRHYVWQLTTELLGALPKDPEVYKAFIESKRPKPELVVKTANALGEVMDDEPITVEEAIDMQKEEEKGWTGFLRDEERGLYIMEYVIKGYLKKSADVLKDHMDVAALRARVNNTVFITPRKIFLGKMEPDGVNERPLRAMTARGERVTVVRSDYVVGCTLEFDVTLVKNKVVDWGTIDYLSQYGQLSGIGQYRTGGYGRFDVVQNSKGVIET